MIIGIGTDLTEVERIAKAASDIRFLEKGFTDMERELFSLRKNNPEVITGNFAVKEAVAKAFGTGFKGISFLDIEVLRNENGGPYVNLHGKAKELAAQFEVKTVHVSISNCKDYALAYVVLEH